ncbi:MAG: 4Fe-4S binding protein [Firmicutes bacterium]|nr:4Fe-4S binding protein [Bacillota bacterium]
MAEERIRQIIQLDKKTDKKTKKRIHTALRAAIQISFFILLPSAYTAAFGGAKYLFTQLGAGEFIQWTPFLAALVLLCGYTMLFGKFFCGYGCAFGSLGDWIYALHATICRIRGTKPKRVSSKIMEALSVIKYLILAAVLLLCFAGIYDKTRGVSPWDVFAQLHAGNLKLAGYWAGGMLLGLILVGMFVQERFFCQVLCPLGAIFSLLPILPFFTLRRKKEACIKGCSACTRNCPSDLELLQKQSLQVMGDCFQCHKCMGVCPRQNITCGRSPLRGNEILFTLIRAALLAALCVWIGI